MKNDNNNGYSTMTLPEIATQGPVTYNIEDCDGSFYMLDRRFSGCVIVGFTQKMDESVWGHVSYQGKLLPRGFIRTLSLAGGHQLVAIPVHGICTQYDMEYILHVEGFISADGLEMRPADITVKTLARSTPDPAYAAHDMAALDIAREGIVCLKNENSILPLPGDARIRLAGTSLFRLSAAGAGRINPRYRVGLLRAIQEQSGFLIDQDADTVLFVVSRGTGENLDNAPVKGEYYLTDAEEEQLATLAAEGKQLIAIVNSGYPMDLRWLKTYRVHAAIWTGFPGMLGGAALVEILDGRVNPSGKLPDTWSIDYFDIPSSANFYTAPEGELPLSGDCETYIDTIYEEDLYVGYRYFDTFHKPVAYPFGFGLSYTAFEIHAAMQGLCVTAAVKNTGSRAGNEVVQVYVQIPEGILEQPPKRLVGFAKTRLLQAGETEILTIQIEKGQLASFDTQSASWVLEKGSYLFFAGNSVRDVSECGEFHLKRDLCLKQSANLMAPPIEVNKLSKTNPEFPTGKQSGIRPGATELSHPRSSGSQYPVAESTENDFVAGLSVEELARLSVCASHGWGMHAKGEAGRIFKLGKYNIPDFVVADGNSGVNINKPNIGMPSSNLVCATWDRALAWKAGEIIAKEALENDINLLLAPGMNIHRNPLNGRHPEYFSEDPYLAGMMAGHHCKGLQDNGVSGCLKHVVANNCESSRKRNHSIMTERALREIYLKAFEVAIGVQMPDTIMTAYNACNGIYTASDAELLQGIFYQEFGFDGFVMTDWNSYDTANIALMVQAGNCWITPGSTDDRFVTPILEGIQNGSIDIPRLRSNVRRMLYIVQKRTGKDLGVNCIS